MPQTFTYEIVYSNQGKSLADQVAGMNAMGAQGWQIADVSGHVCTWIKESVTNDDLLSAINSQSAGSSSLSTFSKALTTTEATLDTNVGNKVQLINTDAVRTIYYRAADSSDDWIPIAPLGASVLLLITNTNLLEMKCDLLTATVYGIVYP